MRLVGGCLIALLAVTVDAAVFMTRDQALASAYPGARMTRETIFLSPEQLQTARRESSVDFRGQLVVRYVAARDDVTVGFVYFDTHRVRTLPETVMVVVSAAGTIEKIDILSFDEPPDYLPKRRWLDQLLGRKLDQDLALSRAIRPISGASLSGRAIVNASRKTLAIHRVIGGNGELGSLRAGQ